MNQLIRQKPTWIVLALLAHAALFYSRVHTSWLFADDFLNVQLSRQNGFTLRFLLQDVFGQVAPGYRVVQLVFDDLFGPSFAWAMVIIGILSVSCTYALIRISDALGARPWAIATGVILFIGLPQFTHLQQWWAAAVHTIFSFTFIMWALVLATTARRDRAIWMALLYACALTFTAKTVCAPAIIAAVVYLRQRRDGVLPKTAILATATELIPIFILTALYLAIVKWIGPASYPPRPSPHDLWKFVRIMVSDTTVGATFGVGKALGLRAPAWITVVAMVVLATTAIRRNKDLGALWIAVLVYVSVAAILIGLNRAVAIPDLAKALRYAAEGAAFLVLAIILSLSALPSTAMMRVGSIAIAVLAAINVQMHRAEATAYPWAQQVKEYVHNLEVTSHELERQPGVYVLEAHVPPVIMLEWMGEYTLVSKFLPIYSSLPVAGADKANYELTQDGRIIPLAHPPSAGSH